VRRAARTRGRARAWRGADPLPPLRRLRRLDALALSAAAEASVSALPGARAGAAALDLDAAPERPLRNALPEPGLPVDYCIFCYHGAARLLRADNTALLSRFVSDRGAILPRRFSHACAKHQRALARTVKRARALNLVPFEAKLHPRARFGAFSPSPADVALAGADDAAGAARLGGDAPRVAQRRAEEAALLESLGAGAAAAKGGAEWGAGAAKEGAA